MRRLLILSILLGLSIGLFAQKGSPWQSLERNHQAEISLRGGQVTALRFPKEYALALQGSSTKEKAQFFLEEYPGIFPSEWEVVGEASEAILGNRHLSLRQLHGGVPVFASELHFHFDTESRLTGINGSFLDKITCPSRPSISPREARLLAEQYVRQHEGARSFRSHTPELCIHRDGMVEGKPGQDYLCYHQEVSNGRDIRTYVLVDALTGHIRQTYPGMCQALHREMSEDSIANVVWVEGEALPDTFVDFQVREITSTEQVYHLFLHTFGYLSYDNADAAMRILHGPQEYDCPNAFWNGEHTTFCDGVGTDDVTAHEWAHAYTEYTSGLIYAWQSGAINEAYSDIWGETIDLINGYTDEGEDLSLRNEGECATSQRWLIGEGAWAMGGAIRDMWHPNCYTHPGFVVDTVYHCENWDNGGVHINSGIINRLYALMVDGGTLNNQTFNALGMTKAAHIFWRAQRVYLTPASGFPELADALEFSCMDLMGVNLPALTVLNEAPGSSGEGITGTDLQTLSFLVETLGLREMPDCNFQPLLAKEAPALCEERDSIFYENFENGTGGWTMYAAPEQPSTWDERAWMLEGDLPESRPGLAMFVPNPIVGNCLDDLENGRVILESPLIPLAGNAGDFPHLVFQHYVATEPQWDGGIIQYRQDSTSEWVDFPLTSFIYNGYNHYLNPSDNPLAEKPAFTGLDAGSLMGSWGETQVDLSVLGIQVGEALQLRWVLGEDGCNGRIGWYVDDVLVYHCQSNTVAVGQVEGGGTGSAYPNPFGEYLEVDWDGWGIAGTVRVRLLDMAGRVVYDTTWLSNDSPLRIENLGHLPTGVYFLQWESPQVSGVQKVLKQ